MRDGSIRLRLESGREVLLVHEHVVERWDAAAATMRMREALRDGLSAPSLRRLAEELSYRGDLEDAEGLAVWLGERIADGELLPIAMASSSPGRPVLGPRHDDDEDWSKAVPLRSLTDDPDLETGWVSIEVLDGTGAPFAGLDVTLVHGDGRRDRVVLDALGRHMARDVAYPGPSRVELPPRIEHAALDPSTRSRDGFERRYGDVIVPRTDAPAVSLPVLDRHYRLILAAEAKTACVRLVGMLFDANKAFLLPAALEGIRLLPRVYEKFPGAELLVVGHTDRTGKSHRNDSLSLERARAILAYMKDDVEAWLAFYDESTDFSRRWGVTEDLWMLSVLPFGQIPFYSPTHAEHSFGAAVRRFQEANELFVDGEPGPQTRRALIEQYMALDATSLPPGVTAVAHGCGEHFLAVPTDDGVDEPRNRRVEIFVFREGVSPVPPGSISEAGSADHAAWTASVDEEYSFTPSASGRGRVEVLTDFDVGYAHHAGLVVELRSLDGAYTRRIDPWDAPQHLTRMLAFTFDDVPEASFLTCVAITSDGVERVLFRDVPFWELSRHHGAEEDADPFEIEETDHDDESDEDEVP